MSMLSALARPAAIPLVGLLAVAGLALVGPPPAAAVTEEAQVGSATARPPHPTTHRPPRTTTTTTTTTTTSTTTTSTTTAGDSVVAPTDGTAVTVTKDGAAGIRKVTFSVQAGQRIFVGCQEDLSGGAPFYAVTDPGGAPYEDVTMCYEATLLNTFTAPAAGSYTIAVDLGWVDSGSVTLTVHTVPDDVVTWSPLDGSAVPVELAPGQGAQISFSVEAGQWYRASCRESDTLAGGRVGYSLLHPDGQLLEKLSCGPIGSTGFFAAETGTYTLIIDPWYADAGTVEVTLYPETIRTTAATDGTPLTTTVRRDQKVRVAFWATPGQRVLITCAESSGLSGTEYELEGPDGAPLPTSPCQGDKVVADTTVQAPGNQRLTISPTVYEGSETVTVRVWVTDDIT